MKYNTEIRKEYHPIANLEPMMQEAELDLLVSLMADGFDKKKPITMFEGKILDGRNRHVAAEYLGIKAETIEFKGTYKEAEAESICLNRGRRHLSPSQKAMAAAYAIVANREDREICKYEFLEINPKMGVNKLAVEIGKKYPKLTAENAAKKYAANVKYVKMCVTYLTEKRFNMSEMAWLIFEGKMDLATAKHRYKELKEKLMLTGIETRVYTEEELLIFEKEDMAKNHPRGAALEIVSMSKTNEELKDVIYMQEEHIEELKNMVSEVSVLRSIIDDISGNNDDEGDW